MNYGKVNRRIEEAASILDSEFEESPRRDFVLALAQATATLAVAEAVLELAREVDGLANEVKRNTHLR